MPWVSWPNDGTTHCTELLELEGLGSYQCCNWHRSLWKLSGPLFSCFTFPVQYFTSLHLITFHWLARCHCTGRIHYLLAQHSVATLLLTIPWLRQILSFFWPNTNLQSSDFQNLIISAHPWFQTHNFAQNLWVTTNLNLKQDKLQVSEWLSECPNYRPAGCFAYHPVTGGTSTSRVGPTNVSNDYFVCYQDLSEYVGLEYIALQ